jgi:hypothetical protein
MDANNDVLSQMITLIFLGGRVHVKVITRSRVVRFSYNELRDTTMM